MISAEGVATLRPFSAGAQAMAEAGLDFVFLPGLQLAVKGKVRQLDALLRPGAMHGYATRMFLSEPIVELGLGMSPFPILGRVWYSPSWNGIVETLPLPRMLLAHMAIYR